MKLYFFQCGTIRTKKRLLISGAAESEEIEVPVFFFLIRHPQGNLLFDTGQALESVHAKPEGDYIAVLNESACLEAQLKKTGLSKEKIDAVILSHAHSDHSGGLEIFTGNECFIQNAEFKSQSGQNLAEKFQVRWKILKGDYDVFGDGRVRIISTPGHSPGHQSLLLRLEKTGEILLCSDSIYMDEILETDKMPGVFHNRKDTGKSIQRIKEMCRKGVKAISGHDPGTLEKFRLYPEFYE